MATVADFEKKFIQWCEEEAARIKVIAKWLSKRNSITKDSMDVFWDAIGAITDGDVNDIIDALNYAKQRKTKRKAALIMKQILESCAKKENGVLTQDSKELFCVMSITKVNDVTKETHVFELSERVMAYDAKLGEIVVIVSDKNIQKFIMCDEKLIMNHSAEKLAIKIGQECIIGNIESSHVKINIKSLTV